MLVNLKGKILDSSSAVGMTLHKYRRAGKQKTIHTPPLFPHPDRSRLRDLELGGKLTTPFYSPFSNGESLVFCLNLVKLRVP